jgi:hypothetical protein
MKKVGKWIVLYFLTLVIAGVAKAVGDWVSFGNTNGSFLYPWIHATGSAGNIFTCDLWHFCQGHIRQLMHGCAFAIGVVAGVEGYITLKLYNDFRKWVLAILFILVGYWFEGFIFKLFYKVILMHDWTWMDLIRNII